MTEADAVKDVIEWLNLKLVSGRCSKIFIGQLAWNLLNRQLDVFRIYDEVALLEGHPMAVPTRTKGPSTFSGPLLKGLKYKHFTQAAYIAQNLLNAARRVDADALYASIEADPNVSPERRPDKFIHEMSIGLYERHALAGSLTGEWIVYAEQNDVKYYLMIARHGDDAATWQRCKACAADFPELDILRKDR